MNRTILITLALIAGCSPPAAPAAAVEPPSPPGAQTAIFAGGCFWSAEKAFEHVRGVSSVVSGFTGGTVERPTYAQVVRGGTGHLEAIRVTFDPSIVSYRALVDRYWRTIDPTDPNGVFCDQGPSYHTAVFASAGQMAAANASRQAAQQALGRRFVTPVRTAQPFWPAEAYHQNYFETHAAQYEAYRIGCGRTAALRRVWGDAAVV